MQRESDHCAIVDSGYEVVSTLQAVDYQRPENPIPATELGNLLPLVTLALEARETLQLQQSGEIQFSEGVQLPYQASVAAGVAARNQLVEGHIHVAHEIGSLYGEKLALQALPVVDLTQSAAVGLIEATDAYDFRESSSDTLAYGPTVRERARRAALHEVTRLRQDALFYADPIDMPSPQLFIDAPMTVEEQVALAISRDRVTEALRELPDDQRTVLEERFGFNGEEHTIGQAGAAIGLDPRASRQVHERAIVSLIRTLIDFEPDDIRYTRPSRWTPYAV